MAAAKPLVAITAFVLEVKGETVVVTKATHIPPRIQS